MAVNRRGRSMVDAQTAIDYLVEHGLIDGERAEWSRWTARHVTRRNRSVRVEGPSGAGLFIKQPDDPARAGAATLRRECRFLELCRDEPAAAPVRPLVPRLLHVDEGIPAIVLELIRDGVPLWDCWRAGRPGHIPLAPARAVGSALGKLHRTFRRNGRVPAARVSWLPTGLPWGLRLHRPGPDVLTWASPAQCRILATVQNEPEFGARLDRLAGRWAPDTVIHTDLKTDNVLIVKQPTGDTSGESLVRLVDWEFVQFGDPAWDVGGVLQDFVHFWIHSLPLAEPLDARALAGRARYPLAAIHAAVRAFALGYAAGARLDGEDAVDLLLRAVEFSAARMVQTAYEWSEGCDRLPRQSILLLQVSAHILDGPRAASEQLYGQALPRTLS